MMDDEREEAMRRAAAFHVHAERALPYALPMNGDEFDALMARTDVLLSELRAREPGEDLWIDIDCLEDSPALGQGCCPALAFWLQSWGEETPAHFRARRGRLRHLCLTVWLHMDLPVYRRWRESEGETDEAGIDADWDLGKRRDRDFPDLDPSSRTGSLCLWRASDGIAIAAARAEAESKARCVLRCAEVARELMAAAWHPSRFQHWCLSRDELLELAADV